MILPETYYVLIILGLSILVYTLLKQVAKYKFAKRSLSAKYGNKIEQFMPFMKDYPFDPDNFKFLGRPIDGISFNDTDIVFVEFKTEKSQLNDKQRLIKNLIKNKRVKFKEVRI